MQSSDRFSSEPQTTIMQTGFNKQILVLNRRCATIAAVILMLIALGPMTLVGRAQDAKPDISGLSLENLSSMEITSAAKKEQKLSETAAAIFVITSEDIRRSGLTSIPELLRTVPGMAVAQMDGNKWAVTTRGFNERYADRILVLLDGRSLLTPLLSSVNWDIQEIMLEDVERIEVIRGPGATIWGANAMNGVVNIITKKAKATQGWLASGAISKQDLNSGAARFGSTLGLKGTYRIFGKYMDRAGSARPTGDRGPDHWHDFRGGFRTDWALSESTSLTVQGQAYKSTAGGTAANAITVDNPLGAPFVAFTRNSGGHLLAQWTRTSSHLDTSILGYIDSEHRNEPGIASEVRWSEDLQLTQHYHSSSRQDVSWGADFRNNADKLKGTLSLSFDPANRVTQLFGAYIQDEMTLVPGKLKLTAGGKLEHNFYSGFAFQPNIRTSWTPGTHVSIWASAAQAAASPSRIDTEIRFNEAFFPGPNGLPMLLAHFGTLHLKPETVRSYETGLRFMPHPKVSFDLATFINTYENFHTDEPGTPFIESGYDSLPTHLVIPDYVKSEASAVSRGAELLVEVHPTTFWKLSASYTGLLIHLSQSAISGDALVVGNNEGSTPRHQGQVHSLLNLPHKFEFDTAAYYVGDLTSPQADAYTRVDARLGWKLSPSLEISAGGRNLLQATHPEFGTGEALQTESVARSAFLTATWKF